MSRTYRRRRGGGLRDREPPVKSGGNEMTR